MLNCDRSGQDVIYTSQGSVIAPINGDDHVDHYVLAGRERIRFLLKQSCPLIFRRSRRRWRLFKGLLLGAGVGWLSPSLRRYGYSPLRRADANIMQERI